MGQQELVIKAIDSNYTETELVAGASIRGDGRVILILDVPAIFRKAIEDEKEREIVPCEHGEKIKVLVVDDSALMRKMIPQILSADPDIEVIGTAMDGLFALKKINDLKPDVITLDVNMPRMDGIEALRHIVKNFGTPTIIVSSPYTEGCRAYFKCP